MDINITVWFNEISILPATDMRKWGEMDRFGGERESFKSIGRPLLFKHSETS